MDPKLTFWTAALPYTLVLIGCAAAGWWQIRRGNVRLHRRLMNLTVLLAVGFVLAYALKVVVLGKEDLAVWSSGRLLVLRIHETIVAIMLLAGGTARFLARRFDDAGHDVRGHTATLRRRHRRAGRTALVAGIFAVATALMVLAGMHQS